MSLSVGAVCSTAELTTQADISYWQHSVMGGVGFMVEAATAMTTGGVAKTGNLRQFTAEEIDEVRSRYSDLSS